MCSKRKTDIYERDVLHGFCIGRTTQTKEVDTTISKWFVAALKHQPLMKEILLCQNCPLPKSKSIKGTKLANSVNSTVSVSYEIKQRDLLYESLRRAVPRMWAPPQIPTTCDCECDHKLPLSNVEARCKLSLVPTLVFCSARIFTNTHIEGAYFEDNCSVLYTFDLTREFYEPSINSNALQLASFNSYSLFEKTKEGEGLLDPWLRNFSFLMAEFQGFFAELNASHLYQATRSTFCNNETSVAHFMDLYAAPYNYAFTKTQPNTQKYFIPTQRAFSSKCLSMIVSFYAYNLINDFAFHYLMGNHFTYHEMQEDYENHLDLYSVHRTNTMRVSHVVLMCIGSYLHHCETTHNYLHLNDKKVPLEANTIYFIPASVKFAVRGPCTKDFIIGTIKTKIGLSDIPDGVPIDAYYLMQGVLDRPLMDIFGRVFYDFHTKNVYMESIDMVKNLAVICNMAIYLEAEQGSLYNCEAIYVKTATHYYFKVGSPGCITNDEHLYFLLLMYLDAHPNRCRQKRCPWRRAILSEYNLKRHLSVYDLEQVDVLYLNDISSTMMSLHPDKLSDYYRVISKHSDVEYEIQNIAQCLAQYEKINFNLAHQGVKNILAINDVIIKSKFVRWPEIHVGSMYDRQLYVIEYDTDSQTGDYKVLKDAELIGKNNLIYKVPIPAADAAKELEVFWADI